VFLALALPVLAPAAIMGAIAIAVPLNLTWYCMENIAFLLYPASQASRGLGDIQFIGRQVFMLSVKITLLSLGAILAVAIGYWLATSFTLDVQQFVFVIAFVLLMEGLLLFALLARVFNRLDLSRSFES